MLRVKVIVMTLAKTVIVVVCRDGCGGSGDCCDNKGDGDDADDDGDDGGEGKTGF